MFQLLALYMGSLILRCVGIALFAGFCSWKIRNVAIRHAIWVAVLGSLLLMPAVDYLLPVSWVPVRIQQITAKDPVPIRVISIRDLQDARRVEPATPAASAAVPARLTAVDWWGVAAAFYALVAIAMFIRLVTGYGKLRKLRGTARAITGSVWEEIINSQRTHWRMPALLESEAAQVPMTIGIIRPAVILPVDWMNWDDWKLRAVLLHELAHVRRFDWGIAVVAAAARCAFWLNPVSWFLERHLSQLAEQACDDATLSNTRNPTRYAEILLEFAVTAQNGGRLLKGGVAMAQPNMKTRIERVLGNPKTGKGIVKIAGWALVMMAAVPVMYSAAALQVKSEPVKPPVAAYAGESGRNLMQQTPAPLPQAAPSPVPVTAPQAQQDSPNPSGDPQASYDQWDAKYEKLRRTLEVTEQTFQMLQKYNQFNVGPALEPQSERDTSVRNDALRMQLGAEVEMRKRELVNLERQVVNQPNPSQSQLDQLRVIEEMLGRLQAELRSLGRRIEEKKLTSSSSQVADSNSKYRVFVTGRVQRPGDIPWDKPLTVLQALTLAGGFQEYAKRDAISIIRMNGNSSTLFGFNYSEVIDGVNRVQNIYLENGDVVVVP